MEGGIQGEVGAPAEAPGQMGCSASAPGMEMWQQHELWDDRQEQQLPARLRMSYEGSGGGVLALQGAGCWACTEHRGNHEDSWCWRERRDGRAFREACLLPPCSFCLLPPCSLCLLPPRFLWVLLCPLRLLCAFLLQLLFSSTHTLLPCSPAGSCAHDQEPSGRHGLVLSVCEHRSFSAFIPVSCDQDLPISLVWGCAGWGRRALLLGLFVGSL